jgi:cell division protein FtsN
MAEGNTKVRGRERFELALDGRQVASIVVGALVVVAVVFLLGLNVGKQLGVRAAERPRAGDLDALDRAPAPPPAAKPEQLTFHERLTQAAPPPAPPREPAKPPPAPPAPAPAAAPAAPKPVAEAAPEPPGPAPAAPRPVAAKPWTVQLAAAEARADAEKLQTRFASLGPRIEEAVVGGKRFYRVRVGSFDTKDAAQRYLKDVARETGAKGIVAPSR